MWVWECVCACVSLRARAWVYKICSPPLAYEWFHIVHVCVCVLSQKVRLFAGQPYAEFEWIVGPIPINDHLVCPCSVHVCLLCMYECVVHEYSVGYELVGSKFMLCMCVYMHACACVILGCVCVYVCDSLCASCLNYPSAGPPATLGQGGDYPLPHQHLQRGPRVHGQQQQGNATAQAEL